MKTIPLTQGYVALVDDDDYERVAAFKWHTRVDRKKRSFRLYAARTLNGPGRDGKNQTIRMHSFIIGYKRPDHIDGNGLNNQKNNLRPANSSQNGANRKNPGNGVSKFRGVVWRKDIGKWQAKIGKDRIRYHLGHFTDEVDAATAYNFKAFELFGEFAGFNVPLEVR